jgi:membrane-associated protein
MLDFFINFFLNLDTELAKFVTLYGVWVYALLFLIIFAETGLVVTPFLPGDSLLFTAGVFSNPDRGAFNVWLLLALLMSASFLGDNVNFWVGRVIGRRVFRSRFFKKEYLEKTREFYDRHGTKTVVIGRFVPIVRTFAPFVAGMDAMAYPRFLVASAVGAIAWVGLCVLSGYFFGRIPWVEQNFALAILMVIGLSLVGIFVEFARSRIKLRRERREGES